jgi:hypothetical protein
MLSERVFLTLVVQHAMLMLSIILSCPALQQFATLPHKRQEFRRKVTECKMCFNFILRVVLKHFSIFEILSDIIIHVHRTSCKVPEMLSAFNDT